MAELAQVERNGIRKEGSRVPRTMTSPLAGLLGWDPFRIFDNVGPLGTAIQRTENGYELELPVPGFAPDQVELSYHDGVVQLNAKNERRQLTQSFMLPDDADPDKIEAHVANGMLSVHVERYEQAKPRKIAIKA